jgi:aryl carrier-like protein
MEASDMNITITHQLDRQQFEVIVAKLDAIADLIMTAGGVDSVHVVALTEKLKASESSLRAAVSQAQPSPQV